MLSCQNVTRLKPDYEFFSSVINFIRHYVDEYHHIKEEDILFKSVLEIKNCQHISVMLNEHNEGRKFIQEMGMALLSSDPDQLVSSARNYCYMMKDHIYKEERIIYPIAEKFLDENIKIKIENQYNSIQADELQDYDINSIIEKLVHPANPT